MRGFIVPAICALIFAGCASTSGTQTSRRTANVITAEEIADARRGFEFCDDDLMESEQFSVHFAAKLKCVEVEITPKRI